MNLINELTVPGVAAAHELHAAMEGNVVLLTNPDYANARKIWNGA